MRMALTLLRKTGYSVAIAGAVAFSAAAPATTIGLSDTPLFLSAGAQPNLIMAIDDSGSMDFEVLFPGNDGSAWWRAGGSDGCGTTDVDSFIGCISNAGTGDMYGANQLNFNNAGNANGTWKKYSYLFPNGTGGNTSARRRSGDSDNDHFAIPPLKAYAWARAPKHNAAYFNPLATYLPWVSEGLDSGGVAYTFTNATRTATRFDAVFESTVTIDLTRDYAGNGNADLATACESLTNARSDNYLFKTFRGMTLPRGTCFRGPTYEVPDGPDRGTDPDIADDGWQVVTRTGGCEVGVTNGCATAARSSYTLDTGTRVAIRYFPATFWLPSTQALPASYGWSGTAITGGTAPDGSALVGYEIKPGNFSTSAQYDAAIQNFANWFQYYRKRHQALRGGLGNAFQDMGGIRVDGFTINNVNNSVTMGSIDDATVKRNLYSRFYRDWVQSGGTPNRTAVAALINNFKRTDDTAPVTLSCQKNFGMLFTDGFSNAPADRDGIRGVYANVDGTQGDPYDDTYSGSLADAVMSAYINPLRTDAGFTTGKVSVPGECGTGDYSGPLDCNRNLHMNFYAITLGTRGLLFNPDATVNPYTVTPQLVWPTSFPARHPSAVDDLWHATINGRGQLLNARSPQEISDKLKEVLRSIIDRNSTAAAAALNSGSIGGNSRIFQARFNSKNWTGQLLSFGIDPTNGQLRSSDVVDAAQKLRETAAASRKIFTRNTAGQAVPFKWESGALLGDGARELLLTPTRVAGEAERMVNYLRGDASNEGTGATNYRVRGESSIHNKLGDIVSSAPLYVGAPPFRYRDSLQTAAYSEFVTRNQTRPPMVYVGANDGMLHAFYAGGANIGREAFAYVPGAVFPKLRLLASQSYGHQFYVDGSPSMGDAFYGGAWHTVVTGGLNKGGQGVYAIDVTNPETVSASSMLWEFTDANDADLGFTYSQPVIAKLRDGEWYAIFGNGYNNTLADGRASATGNAVLFLVNIGTGVARKIDTGIGVNATEGRTFANGLATPTVVDLNGDRVAEYAYAGDLYGNLWKFDLSSTTNTAWTVAFSGAPLFKARNNAGAPQPITVRPEVARGPNGNGQIVLFGTGKYLEPSDKLRSPQVIQSFYGIIDRNAAVTYADNALRTTVLTEQVIHDEVQVAKTAPNGDTIRSEVRLTSNNSLGGTSQGWYMDLLSPDNGYEAEKAATNPVVRDGKVIFTTLVPDADPCGFGGSSWLMELDMLDGSRLEASPFDLNRDGLFTTADNVAGTINGAAGNYPSGGIRSTEGILQTPGVANGEFGVEGRGTPVQYKYLPGSSGNIQVIIENPGIGGTGRQSWRQIR